MQTTWTTKSGKNIELTTTVIGETAKDHIRTQFSLTIDGKKVNVLRQTTVKGQDCLEFVFVGTTTKQLLPIDSTIATTIASELKAVKDAVPAVDVSLSKYERDYETLSRLMDDKNSDH